MSRPLPLIIRCIKLCRSVDTSLFSKKCLSIYLLVSIFLVKRSVDLHLSHLLLYLKKLVQQFENEKAIRSPLLPDLNPSAPFCSGVQGVLMVPLIGSPLNRETLTSRNSCTPICFIFYSCIFLVFSKNIHE